MTVFNDEEIGRAVFDVLAGQPEPVGEHVMVASVDGLLKQRSIFGAAESDIRRVVADLHSRGAIKWVAFRGWRPSQWAEV